MAAHAQKKITRTSPHVISGGLGAQYRSIGRELLILESAKSMYRSPTQAEIDAFRQGVSFVGIQVLESYLDDLLDLEISDETLSIKKDSSSWSSIYIPLTGILLAFATGLYSRELGATLPLSFSLTISMAMPFLALFYYSPKVGLSRRIYFAQTISNEVSRRRGEDESGRSSTRDTNRLRALLGSRSSQTPLSGAARTLWH